jgi:O-methyltransferase involved in polyketide biosynthesis
MSKVPSVAFDRASDLELYRLIERCVRILDPDQPSIVTMLERRAAILGIRGAVAELQLRGVQLSLFDSGCQQVAAQRGVHGRQPELQ